jgi:hypothetical protein
MLYHVSLPQVYLYNDTQVFIPANERTGTSQMSILQTLPFSLSKPGPEHVDGVGNFYLQILGPASSPFPLSTLFFLDSHGQIPSEVREPDYDPIKQSQIDWFTKTSKAQRSAREVSEDNFGFHLSLVFLHIPLPEYRDCQLRIHSGHRREPSESPSFNSHFYDALVQEGISAIACGHDHVNDFCGLLRPETNVDKSILPQNGPWLCYAGCSGFGGYCSYGSMRFHRRMRVWELDTSIGSLRTWKRVEYATGKVDELVLIENGVVANPQGE